MKWWIRAIVIGFIVSVGYVLWHWFASGTADLCVAMINEDAVGQCQPNSWSSHTIAGARSALVFFGLMLSTLVCCAEE